MQYDREPDTLMYDPVIFQLKVLKNYVLILPARREEVAFGKLVLPNMAAEKMQRGTVINAGPDCTEVKETDEVLFDWYGGKQFICEGERLYVAEESDILCVVERQPGTNDPIWVLLPALTRDKDRMVLT